jgi:L-ribulokinase
LSTPAFTVGVDFGTNSVRAIVVNCRDGHTLGTKVFPYPSGDRGVLLKASDPNLARQNPADYIEGLRASVNGALSAAERTPGFARRHVIGIGADTTGSTPLPVDANARPLALDPRWRNHLAAQAWLWKDHTASAEAAAITEMAARAAPEYLAPIGGVYSSEWWWSKIWRCLKVAPDVFHAAVSWVELADYIPALLAGVSDPGRIVRSVCAAGHKAMFSEDWGGLPAKMFLARLDPDLAALRDQLYDEAWPPGVPSGRLCSEWASKLDLPEGIAIAMGGFDAHYGAVGSGIEPGTLVKIIGTSTCDCAISPFDSDDSRVAQGKPVTGGVREIPGICGIVKGSILPGYYGIEAGQSAVGDLLSWWAEEVGEGTEALHIELSRQAAKLKPGASGLLALDWNNGNRTVLVDSRLTGLLVGQTLHTTRAEIYRALIEATAFGARTIIERLRNYGVPIDRVVCCGGIAEKNDVFMQIYADVIGQPMFVAGSMQTPALGAALSAAVTAGAAAGGFDDWREAQTAMTTLGKKRLVPNPEPQAVYNELFALYSELHDGFGGVPNARADFGTLMKRLLDIKDRR